MRYNRMDKMLYYVFLHFLAEKKGNAYENFAKLDGLFDYRNG